MKKNKNDFTAGYERGHDEAFAEILHTMCACLGYKEIKKLLAIHKDVKGELK